MKRQTLISLIALGAMTAGAQAHGIWVAQRHDDLAVVYGHGASDEAYKPEKVREAVGTTETGAKREVRIVAGTKNTLLEPTKDTVILAVTFDNGIWTKGADGKSVDKPKSAVPGAQSASRSIKLNTTILGRGAPSRPLGRDLEIVPLVDPMTLKIGDDLPVQVLAAGKPLPDVALAVDYVNDGHAMSNKTDANGKAVLFVRNDGLNVIGVAHVKKTPDDPDADQISYYATLSFALPHADD